MSGTNEEKKEQKYTLPNTYGQQITDAANAYTNRAGFSYDPNTDQTFQDYAAAMKKNGALAMEDTVGKAASMTGGYGNSYAETVGQQVYDNYMDTIHEKGLEFRKQALNEHNAEGDRMRDNLSVLLGLQENENSNYLTGVELADKEKAELAADEAAENEKAYAIAQATGQWDDYYRNVLGMTDEQIQQANLYSADIANSAKPALGEEELNGLWTAINSGNGTDYLNALMDKGYNLDNIEADIKLAKAKGLLPNTVVLDTDKQEINFSGAFGKAVASSLANGQIEGLNNTNDGQNFHVDVNGNNDNKEGYGSLDVQIGTESKDLSVKAAASEFADNALFVYEDEIYIKKNGKTYSVKPQAWREDEYDLLKDYIEGHKNESNIGGYTG